ncbi:unnamed protein product [Pleuronectes platessa]|uniref:Secreted protein n=1 Tax=Pleuronectes platessa TaxID=8262 RepID=A0A9N7USP3_PLEPL|nr:unnamed protein product [Pleuronectes platessa]
MFPLPLFFCRLLAAASVVPHRGRMADDWEGAELHHGPVTDLRKPVAATPPQEIMCLFVCVAAALPGTTLPMRTAQVFNMGEERRRTAFRSASTSGASPGLEDDVKERENSVQQTVLQLIHVSTQQEQQEED